MPSESERSKEGSRQGASWGAGEGLRCDLWERGQLLAAGDDATEMHNGASCRRSASHRACSALINGSAAEKVGLRRRGVRVPYAQRLRVRQEEERRRVVGASAERRGGSTEGGSVRVDWVSPSSGLRYAMSGTGIDYAVSPYALTTRCPVLK